MTDSTQAAASLPILSYDYRDFDIMSNNIPEPESALIVRISLAALPSGDPASPSAIQLKILGWLELDLTGHESFEDQIRNYIAQPDSRAPLSPHDIRRYPSTASTKPTKMSLRNQKLRHIVYHLDDELAWRFARNFDPFTQEPLYEGSNVFLNPRLIKADGTIAKVGEHLKDCRFATFIFDPTSALVPKDFNIKYFVARFNMQVELLHKPNEIDGPRIPIILDPDVRWPGGDGP